MWRCGGDTVTSYLSRSYAGLSNLDTASARGRQGRPRAVGDAESKKRVMDEVARRKGVETQEDWRRVATKDVASVPGGPALLRMHSYSITSVLRDAYPEEEFDERICRPSLPRRYWEDEENCRRFMDSLAAAHGVENASDWRRVGPMNLVEAGGSGLLRRNGSSVLQVLEAVYGAEFKGERISAVMTRPVVTSKDWSSPENVRSFLEIVRRRYDVRGQEDWFRLSTAELQALPAGRSFLANNDLLTALKECFRDQHWDESLRNTATAKRSTQRHLRGLVTQLFAGYAL